MSRIEPTPYAVTHVKMADSSSSADESDAIAGSRVRWSSLLIAILIMTVGTIYPYAAADATGKADHGMATALYWAMAAGFVHGVGFIPRHIVWRVLFSPWVMWGCLAIYAGLKFS